MTVSQDYLMPQPSNQYFAQPNALESFRRPEDELRSYKKPKKYVSISMTDTPGNFIARYKNSQRKRMNMSPNIINQGRGSVMASPKTTITNRSSTSTHSYNFRIGSSNKSNRFMATSPRNPYSKRKSRISEKSSNQGYVAALQKELENEQYHLQTKAKLMKEMEDLHVAYKAREDKILLEHSKEKEIYKNAIIEKDQKLEKAKEKIRELNNLVNELTNKNKHHEADIHMLEVTARETENTGKSKHEHFETTIQQINKQLQEQQEIGHSLKDENNTLKIQINQLKKTVEGQKEAYENLRNQMANMYKQKQNDGIKEPSYSYVPKVTVDIEDRGRKDYARKSNRSVEPEPYFTEDSQKGTAMRSRWAKPVSEITKPAGFQGSTSTPRPEGFGYRSSFTRNSNKETSMMEKYCSNSVGEILNWGQ